MASLTKLMELYESRKEKIKRRLEEFSKKGQESDNQIFAELCFCLLTPQSKAKKADKVVKKMQSSGTLYKGDKSEVRNCLSGVRFPNEKTKRIIAAREFFMDEGKLQIKNKLPENVFETREWLVKNIDGLGYKEASHFLRNIGYRGLAILDRHILKNLLRYGIIDKIPKTLTRKRYLEIEKEMHKFSESVGISIDELDLLLWSKETGEILK